MYTMEFPGQSGSYISGWAQ